LLSAALAHAHITLDEPPQRDAAMKTGPCGGTGARSASPKVFAPGESITVKWHETIAHPGFFRIALSKDGTTFPADPPDPPPPASGDVLAIVQKVNNVTEYTQTITLPSAPCATCTIQVIQYMRQHSPPPYYYQCADIVVADGAPPPTTEVDASTSGGGGDGAPRSDDGGCSVMHTAPASRPLAALLVAALAAACVSRRFVAPT
jgi:hypothetical protein